MSNKLSSASINTAFVHNLGTAEGREKTALMGAAFTKERLRETSYYRKIQPPERVTKADCQRSVNHEGLSKIVDIEPQSSAMVLNFRAEPDARLVSGPRYELLFHTVSSERFEKDEQELASYEMPITKVIEQNTVKDIQSVEDFVFTGNARQATLVTQKTILDGDPGHGIASKSNLTELFDQLDDSRLAVGTILMTKSQVNKYTALSASEIGDVIASEITRDGYKYPTILGHALVTTIKTDILSPREIWVFADPDCLGKFYILDDTKFYIDKRFNWVEWQAWEVIAAGFGNIQGIARRLWYEGLPTITGVTPLDSPLLADPDELGVIPLDEGVIFAK